MDAMAGMLEMLIKLSIKRQEVGHGESLMLRSPEKSCFGPSRISKKKHGIRGHWKGGRPHEGDQYLLLSPRTEEGFHTLKEFMTPLSMQYMQKALITKSNRAFYL
jgi:hypothetical protein